MVTIDSLQEVASALSDILSPTPYNLPFSHNTAGLAYHSALTLQGHPKSMIISSESQYATSYY